MIPSDLQCRYALFLACSSVSSQPPQNGLFSTQMGPQQNQLRVCEQDLEKRKIQFVSIITTQSKHTVFFRDIIELLKRKR